MNKIIIAFGFWSLLFTANAQCDFGEHSNNASDAWVSCETSVNPNPDRPAGHWIMYDLGGPHAFFESHIWNYNIAGNTGQGVKVCHFDFSLDGENWTAFGTQEIPQASGLSNYTGVSGPDFSGTTGRYLLITVESNWNGNACSGFAELRVDVEETSIDIQEAGAISMQVYPNPVSDLLTIRKYSGEQVTLQVFDLSGKLAFEQTMIGTTAYVNVAALPDGLYLVRLSDNQGNSTVQRFVIAH